MSGSSQGSGWDPPAPGSRSTPGTTATAWARFRRWPAWAQGLVWVLAWPVPLVLLALAKPRAGRAGWWALAVAGLAAWIGIVAGASQQAARTVKTAASTSSTAGASTEAASSTAATSSTTTTVDPDEVSDPSAVGATPPPAAPTASPSTGAACRSGNPLANVYHPSRLEVVKPCITVTGTVVAVRYEPDGDIHINLDLDSQYAGLINSRNVSGEGGALVTEIVPADEPGCTPGQPASPAEGTYDYGVCTGADETAPSVGRHVAVTGPYVLDSDHGWMEIHPVWSIGSSTTSAPPTTAAPAQPATTATASSGTTITSGPGTVNPGQQATLAARTSPGAACNLSVTLPSGRQSTSSGLGPGTANSSGTVTWTWKIGTTTSPGTATAYVTCPTGNASTTFQIT